MLNKKQKSNESAIDELKMPSHRTKVLVERRHTSRSQDLFYRLVVGLNVIAWILLVISLVVFHYARPEFIAGVQVFWGIDGREFWSQPHLQQLLLLLQGCLVLSLVSIIMRTRRNRRKTDFFGVNLLILFGISVLSLLVLYLFL
ncbi:hypothetical protein [Glaciecola sp. SC05]|uniref:hypothetical protein n=1 Tax=Glaciecola sp. SC05 TaxID=1987355 RepID=UPI00352722CC